MGRYAIWDKKSAVITPVGEVLSAAEWIGRYPAAGVDGIKVVCAGGEINGAFFGTLGQMVEMYGAMGCDFSECVTDQDKLAAIEAFEDERNKPDTSPSAEERIAAAMEYQNIMSI